MLFGLANINYPPIILGNPPLKRVNENTKLNEEVTTSISTKQYKSLLKRIKNLEKK